MKTQAWRKGGFTILELMIVVAVIGLLAAIAIPNFVKARGRSQTNACINNLRQIDSAKQQWAMETKQPGNATPTSASIEPYMGRGSGSLLNCVCPIDTAQTFTTSYAIGDMDTAPVCKFFDASAHNAALY